jgi:hypothetical protein
VSRSHDDTAFTRRFPYVPPPMGPAVCDGYSNTGLVGTDLLTLRWADPLSRESYQSSVTFIISESEQPSEVAQR